MGLSHLRSPFQIGSATGARRVPSSTPLTGKARRSVLSASGRRTSRPRSPSVWRRDCRSRFHGDPVRSLFTTTPFVRSSERNTPSRWDNGAGNAGPGTGSSCSRCSRLCGSGRRPSRWTTSRSRSTATVTPKSVTSVSSAVQFLLNRKVGASSALQSKQPIAC